MSFSKGFQRTLFIGTGDSLEAETKTGAGTGTEAANERGTGGFAEVTADTPTAIAFSIRLCTLEGSMTCWLSSGGGVGPISPLEALHCVSTGSVFTASVGLFWLSWSLFKFSCSAALCRAASTRSLKSLKSWVGNSSGGVGGGVLKRPLVGLAAIVVLVRQAPCSSASLRRLCVSSFNNAWTDPSLPG